MASINRLKAYNILKLFLKRIRYYCKYPSFIRDSFVFSGDYFAYSNRSQHQAEYKDYIGSINDLNESIRLRSNWYISYLYRSRVKAKIDDFEGAISDLNKVIELSDKTIGYLERGNNYFKINDFNKAISDYTRCLELTKNNSSKNNSSKDMVLLSQKRDRYEALFHIGLSQFKLGDFKSSIEYFSEALDLLKKENPYHNSKTEYCELYKSRASSFFKLKEYENAINDVNSKIELWPKNHTDYYFKGIVYVKLNQYPEAIVAFTKSIELKQDEPFSFLERGSSKQKLFDYLGAISDFNKAIDLSPNLSRAYYYRGQVNIILGQISDGLRDLGYAGELGYKKAYEELNKYNDLNKEKFNL